MHSGFKTSLLFLQLLLCTKINFFTTSTLMSLLMKQVCLSMCLFWQGTSKPLLRADLSSELFHVQDTLDCTLHLFGLTFSWKFCFLLQNKLFIPSNLY